MVIDLSPIILWIMMTLFFGSIIYFLGLLFEDFLPNFLPFYKKVIMCAAFAAVGYLTFQPFAPLPVQAYPVLLVLAVLIAIIAAATTYALKLNTSPALPFALAISFFLGVQLLPGSNLGLTLLLVLGAFWSLKMSGKHNSKETA